jgi:hypothetical protein
MIKGSLALMLSHGQRPRKQLGHHIAIIEFAQKNLYGCPATTFILFDRMRRKRNDAFYDVAIISDTDAEEAVSTQSNSCGLLMILAFWSGPAVEVNFGPPGRVLATLRGWGNESVAG